MSEVDDGLDGNSENAGQGDEAVERVDIIRCQVSPRSAPRKSRDADRQFREARICIRPTDCQRFHPERGLGASDGDENLPRRAAHRDIDGKVNQVSTSTCVFISNFLQ